MTQLELPALRIDAVATTVEPPGPLLINRDPGPDETDVPIGAAVRLQLVDSGFAGIDVASTRVWVDGTRAFDGGTIAPQFAGTRAEAIGSLSLTLDPVVPFVSQSAVTIRVVSNVLGGGLPLDISYCFHVEDRTAPKFIAAQAIGQKQVRLAFEEPVLVADALAIVFKAIDLPAVPIRAVSASATSTLIDVVVDQEMTPDVAYQATAAGVTDLHGNPAAAPFDTATFSGFRPPRPATRRFDLWSMLPKHNRRADSTGDLAKFIACLQEVTDLLLTEVDRFPDIFDLERAPEPFLDLILRDLGNPFPFDLDTLEKRRLAAVLVDLYRRKGTAAGIRAAIRFFVGVDVEAITGMAESGLILGESLLGVDWVLGPSSRFARYAFDLRVNRVLTDRERKQLRVIVDYLKPAHTHFLQLLEPGLVPVDDVWELGISLLGKSSVLS